MAGAVKLIENIDIGKIFEEVADLLDLQGANQFRVRAYRTAARTVESLTVSCASLATTDPKALQTLPGIAKDLAGKICEIVQTGDLAVRRELIAEIPEGLVEIMRIPALGPKRARQFYDAFGIQSLVALEEAARSGKLRELRGIKETLEAKILQGIADRQAAGGRFRLSEAEAYVKPLVDFLRQSQRLRAIDVAGSYRRRRDTVGDIDILAVEGKRPAVANRFLSYPLVRDVLAKGDTKCSIVLRPGLQIDLRIVREESYGAALHYFTGSKPHNIAIRTLGVKQGLKINEYGVFRGDRRIGGHTEEEVFGAVGLPWIPPELREDRGEIDRARENRLPKLVEARQIKGDLQMHTTYSDGKNTILEMLQACRDLGYEYLAITDHTKAVAITGGLDRAGFRKQFREIERAQKSLPQIQILKGAEVDILEDGNLDLDDATLRELDLVVVSVHSRFNMSRTDMTRRVTRAMRHSAARILAHPTGRILGRREPYPLDMEEVVKTARDHGVMLEINAQPERLDLNDLHTQMAKNAGVKLVISSDAHRVEELGCMRYGVDQARRGWCETQDVANTRRWTEFQKLIAK
ncbi:MAG TPA: DNA polymerase/3'-5' exonuclease PolX [Bryobacteraceae bacterium]